MKYLALIAALCAASILVASSLSSCEGMLCGRNSRAVRGAERLDKQYLVELHEYVASGQCDFHCTPDILDPLKKISNREPVLKMRRNGDASITLSFCFDRGVELIFKNTKTDDATISVGWGAIEWEYILLWSKPKPMNK
jgi:hypothetical protein